MKEINKRTEELNGLFDGEVEILKELNNPGGLEKGYKIYYLLDNNWVENYKNSIINNGIKKYNNLLNVSLILPKYEQKDFTYIHKDFKFNFIYNFTLVTQNFIYLFCKNFIIEKQNELKKTSYNIIIGGKCLIIRDKNNGSSPYSCITLYNEKNNKFNNNVDYFLKIDDRKEMNEHLNYILNNNIWNYFIKINYRYKDEYKIIINTKGKTIGYLILNNENIMKFSHIENRYNNYFNKNIDKRIEKKKSSRIENKSLNISMNNSNILNNSNNSNGICRNQKNPSLIKAYANLNNNNQLNNKKNIIMNKSNRKTKQILDQNINVNYLSEESKDKINEELFKLREENNYLKKELKDLKEEYNKEKNKNEQLNLKIKELNENIKKEKENKFKESNIIDSKNKIIELYEDLRSKENEIKNLKSKFPFELSKNEKLMSVIFFSTNQKIHYSIIKKI